MKMTGKKVRPCNKRNRSSDCMNSEVIKISGVSNFDICFVCTADFQASLEITSLLKENGAKLVISKTDSSLHAKFLSKIGLMR